jgi:peptidyl-prolyl cis-trans isomerase SurA
MRTAKLGVLIVCGMFVCGRPVAAVLVDKILAVVNGELLTLQDFEDHLALSRVYQPDGVDVDRQQAFQRFIDQALLRQEALRTRIVQVDEMEVSRHLRELD